MLNKNVRFQNYQVCSFPPHLFAYFSFLAFKHKISTSIKSIEWNKTINAGGGNTNFKVLRVAKL